MYTIYVDELLVCNLYMNWLLLRLTARLTHTGCTSRRLLLGAAVGSLGSLMILLPRMPPVVSIPVKLVLAVPICMAAFGQRGRLLRLSCTYIAVSALMAGLLVMLGSTGLIRLIHANACWYADLSLRRLMLLTIVLYAIITLVQRLRERRPDDSYSIEIRLGSRCVQMPGIADTGNTLTDFYTGATVILCPAGRLAPLGELPHGRPLPYRTVSGSSMVEVFRPDAVRIRSASGEEKCVRALIGIIHTPLQGGIFHPRLLRL